MFQDFGKNAGGKGFGKKGSGKGPDPALAIARKRAAQQPYAKPICREFQRTGKCTFTERTGKPCNFVHVDKLPAALSQVGGLTTADLPGSVQYTYKEGLLCCTCGSETSPAVVASLEAEVAQVSAEVEQERENWTINGPSVSPGFRWPPHEELFQVQQRV